MNILDLLMMLLIALCAFIGFKRGLIRTVYRLVSFFVAGFLARILYPYLARFLRGTPLYDSLKRSISGALNLESVVERYGPARGGDIISALPLPGVLRDRLLDNHNADMYEVLNVTGIQDYISGFLAGIAINGIALVSVFILVYFLLVIGGYMLDIVAMLPVIRTFNRGGGLIVGMALGAGLVYISVVVITMLFASGAIPGWYDWIQGSFIMRWIAGSAAPLTEVS